MPVIRLYHLGPGSTGFRRGILEHVLSEQPGSDFSGLLYLAPTRAYLSNWQREVLHPAAGTCYIPPASNTFKQFARKTVTDRIKGAIILPSALRGQAIAGIAGISEALGTLYSSLCGELKRQFPGASMLGIRETLLFAFEGPGLPESAVKRADAAMSALLAYEDRLASAGLMDEDDIYHLAAGSISPDERIGTLIMDGFFELSPAEIALAERLAEQSDTVIAFIPVSSDNDELTWCYETKLKSFINAAKSYHDAGSPARAWQYTSARSVEREVEDIARRIKHDFISGRLTDLDNITVAFPRLRPYAAIAGRVFRRYGIPFDSSTLAGSLSERADLKALMDFLKAAAEGFPRELTASALTSCFFTRMPAALRDVVPAVALDSAQLAGKGSWLTALGQRIEKNHLSWVRSIINIELTGTYESLSNAVLDVIGRLGLVPSDDAETMPSKDLDFDELIAPLRLLDSLSDGPVTLGAFVDAFESLLMSMSGDRETPGVRFAELLSLRGIEPEVLYIGGLRDGEIPSRPEMDLILPEPVRKHLGLVDIDRHLTLQRVVFERLARSARELRLSYPSMQGEKVFLPSVLLKDAVEVETDVHALLSDEELQASRPKKPRTPREINSIPAFRDHTRLKVTEVDSYRSCPRRHFIENVLGLKPASMAEYEVDDLELGRAIHKVMEELMKLPSPTYEAFRANLEQVLPDILPKYRIDEGFSMLVSAALLENSPQLFEIERENAEAGFRFAEAEKLFDQEIIPGIHLRGKLDRMDTNPDTGAVEVMDYKTGPATITGSKVLDQGRDLQLFLYATMLRNEGLRPERVGIYSLKDMKLKWVPGSRDKDPLTKEKIPLDRFMDAALQYLGDTCREITRGAFPARPMDASWCRSCSEYSFCPYTRGTGGAE